VALLPSGFDLAVTAEYRVGPKPKRISALKKYIGSIGIITEAQSNPLSPNKLTPDI